MSAQVELMSCKVSDNVNLVAYLSIGSGGISNVGVSLG